MLYRTKETKSIHRKNSCVRRKQLFDFMKKNPLCNWKKTEKLQAYFVGKLDFIFTEHNLRRIKMFNVFFCFLIRNKHIKQENSKAIFLKIFNFVPILEIFYFILCTLLIFFALIKNYKFSRFFKVTRYITLFFNYASTNWKQNIVIFKTFVWLRCVVYFPHFFSARRIVS